ncbi:MAG: hypothetical protein ACLR0N_15020 [Bilophila wadsworthia]
MRSRRGLGYAPTAKRPSLFDLKKVLIVCPTSQSYYSTIIQAISEPPPTKTATPSSTRLTATPKMKSAYDAVVRIWRAWCSP